MSVELKETGIQEDEYDFPYHHLPDYSNGKIRITKFWPWTIPYLGRIKLVLDFLDTHNFDSAIDVGCGDGKLINILQRTYKHAVFQGIDCSARCIQYARCFNPPDDTVHFDICAPVENDSSAISANHKGAFDIETMIEVLEHISPDQIDVFLEKSLAFLRPNGYFLLSVPSKNTPVSKKHYQHFTTQQLEKILQNHPVCIVNIEYIDSRGAIMALLNRCLSNHFFILNNDKIINIIFQYYTRHHLHADEKNGEGIFLIARKSN